MIKVGIFDGGFKAEYGNTLKNSIYEKYCDVKNYSTVCAKNDMAMFQVFLIPDDFGTLTVSGASAFSCYEKDAVSYRMTAEVEGGLEVKLNLLGFISDDGDAKKVDQILPLSYINLFKNKVQPVLLEIPVPKDTSAGKYSGVVKIYSRKLFEDEVLIDERTFDIVVKDVTIPDSKDFRFYLDLWQHPCNIARKHEVPYWSDKHFEILETYVATLGDLGQKDITVVASEIPWSGQHCFEVPAYPSDLFEYNMIGITKKADGKFEYDYTAMRRYIDMCLKHGFLNIAVFGLANVWSMGGESFISDYPDGIRLRYFDESDKTYKFMRKSAEIEDYIRSLEGYFITEGLIDRVLITADEPGDIEKFRSSITRLKEVAPSFKLKAAINHVEFVREFAEDLKQIAPVLNYWGKENRFLADFKKKRPDVTVLYYVCCGPDYPNTFIRSPLCESRIIPALAYFAGLDGFLRWNYTVWPENPRERISYRAPGWKAGDTNFVYPSNHGTPILSMRYKILKRGIEDFELLCMLRDKVGADAEIFKTLYDKILKVKSFDDFDYDISRKSPEELYSLEYSDYEEFRALLLDALEN